MLTMFILFAILAVAFGGSALVMSGLRISDLSARSGKAYYSAETGAERLLFETRRNGFDLNPASAPRLNVFGLDTQEDGATYVVNYDSFAPIKFTSIGDYQGAKRSVEISF